MAEHLCEVVLSIPNEFVVLGFPLEGDRKSTAYQDSTFVAPSPQMQYVRSHDIEGLRRYKF